jgi:hypothetical protein
VNTVANSTTSRIAATDQDGFDAVTSVSRYSDHLSYRFTAGAIGTLREPHREPITIRPPREHALRAARGTETKGGTTR